MQRGNALDEACYRFLPSAGWAWEALRRIPAYRREYFSLPNKWRSRLKLKHGGELIRCNRIHAGAKKWGLCFYENPNLCANHAQIFWHPDVFPHTLKIRLWHGQSSSQYDDILNLSELPGRICVLDMPNASRQIRVYTKGYWAQLRCHCHVTFHENSRIEFRLLRRGTSEMRLRTAQDLFDLYDDLPAHTVSHIPSNSQKLRHYLQAYDIRMAGGTHRDVAIAQVGIDRVEEDWNPAGCYLKDRAKRAWQRGRDYVKGEYLQLLG